ncbi:MAG: FtsB family cell division protein [Capsulimonadaceae bacterium]
MAILAGGAALLLAMSVALIAKAIEPYREGSVMRAELAQTDRQIAEADAENDAYRRRLAYLNTPAGITAEARKLGYVKPGEVAIVVEGTPGQFSETTRVDEVRPEPSLADRMRSFLNSICRHL